MINLNLSKQLHGPNGDMKLEINLKIKKGEFLAISGKSGSGKTTLLRIIAGLEKANGEIIISNEIWQKNNKSLPPQKRKIGFLFQDYALFENMSVEENLLFVNKDKNLANRLLEITELTHLKKRLPNTLSGGQKQRVSLCRAIMRRPKLLLLDEPLSALDSSMRNKLQNEILTLHKEFNLTTIMISHDVSEIYKMANRVVVMNNGKIINDGSPKEILLKTKSSQKFSFEGEVLDIIKVDILQIAVISIGQELIEIVISKDEVKTLKIGEIVRIGVNGFTPFIEGF